MPNQRVHMDLFGPLKFSGSGKKHILCITDAFSKYVELVAIQGFIPIQQVDIQAWSPTRNFPFELQPQIFSIYTFLKNNVTL
jgi:hypothetical protein